MGLSSISNELDDTYFPKDAFVVAAHGNSNGIILNGVTSTTDIGLISNFMANHGYMGNQKIFLQVCDSGTSGVAQIMANHYNVTVIAPSYGFTSIVDGGGSYYTNEPNAYYKEFTKND